MLDREYLDITGQFQIMPKQNGQEKPHPNSVYVSSWALSIQKIDLWSYERTSIYQMALLVMFFDKTGDNTKALGRHCDILRAGLQSQSAQPTSLVSSKHCHINDRAEKYAFFLKKTFICILQPVNAVGKDKTKTERLCRTGEPNTQTDIILWIFTMSYIVSYPTSQILKRCLTNSYENTNANRCACP